MSREECREAVVAWFEEHGLLDRVEDHRHSVMHCYRCPSALEPWLSEQWFVAVDRLKGPATEAVTSGKVKFHPERWTQTYLTWMENLKDWCSTATNAAGWMPPWTMCTSARSAARPCVRTKTCSTPGSRASCGPSPRRAGPITPRSWRGTIPPRRSSPRATSLRCGWRAWSWRPPTSSTRSPSTTW